MRNQCLEATKLANSRKKKTSSYTDADVTNQAAIDTTSILHKNQGILSTEIYIYHPVTRTNTASGKNSLPSDYLTLVSTANLKPPSLTAFFHCNACPFLFTLNLFYSK